MDIIIIMLPSYENILFVLHLKCPLFSVIPPEPLFKESDYRPSAQGIGAMEMLLVLAAVLTIIGRDLPRFPRDYRLNHNPRAKGRQRRGRRMQTK